MFNLFKEKPADVKKIRAALLQFIKDKLQKAEGGEGANITGMYIFFHCNDSERYLYDSVVYSNAPGKFKEEIQRIADDYAILLPSTWKLDIAYSDKYPEQSYVDTEIKTALFISARKAGPLLTKRSRAYMRILNGRAEKDLYIIEASSEKINIGREAKIQTSAGHVRKNAIAFITNGTTDMNRSVSRQHAHIEWEAESGSFLIFADEGGIPPNNKMKVRTTSGALIKMQATEVGHRLEEGDQVVLGDNAVLEFTYTGSEQ